MISWLALLLSPMLALGCLTLLYAMATPVCALQAGIWMHGLILLTLIITLGLTWGAWRHWCKITAQTKKAAPLDRRVSIFITPLLIGYLGLWSGLLFSLVILAMWISAGLIPPCLQ